MKIGSNTTSRDLELNGGVETVIYTLDESSSYQPGFLVSLIHFFLTKLRLKEKLTVRIETEKFQEKVLIKRFYEFYQLIVIILFDDKGRIQFQDDFTNKKLRDAYLKKISIQELLYTLEMGTQAQAPMPSDLNDLRKSLFSFKSENKLTKGFSLLIPCFDHLPEFERSRYLYTGTQVKKAYDIEQWVKRLFKYHKLNLDPSGIHQQTFSHISEIVRELFHNTHDWARTTFNDEMRYLPNFRGVYLSLYLESRLRMPVGVIDELSDYIKKALNMAPNDLQLARGQQIGFFQEGYKISIFEISVVDTGPGMARRWLEMDYDEISRELEIESVIKCFHKYVTSDSSGLMNLRGQGLSKVLNIIGRTGFIKIHSGNVLLIRNFLKTNLKGTEIASSSVEFEVKPADRVEGTKVTILYPIIYS